MYFIYLFIWLKIYWQISLSGNKQRGEKKEKKDEKGKEEEQRKDEEIMN